jgi:hypothetical protein
MPILTADHSVFATLPSLLQDAQLFQQLTAGPPPPPPAVAPPPCKVRRATVTTAVGGAGLALGAGVIKLVHFVSSRLQRQRRKAKRRWVG